MHAFAFCLCDGDVQVAHPPLPTAGLAPAVAAPTAPRVNTVPVNPNAQMPPVTFDQTLIRDTAKLGYSEQAVYLFIHFISPRLIFNIWK